MRALNWWERPGRSSGDSRRGSVWGSRGMMFGPLAPRSCGHGFGADLEHPRANEPMANGLGNRRLVCLAPARLRTSTISQGHRTLYRSILLHVLLALSEVGLAIARTYHSPLELKVHVYDALP